MPLYEYVCQDCNKPFDVRASMTAYSEGLHPACPECGSEKVERGFSAFSFLTSSDSSTGTSTGCGPSGFS